MDDSIPNSSILVDHIHFLMLQKLPKIANFIEFLKSGVNPCLKIFQFLKIEKNMKL